MASGFSHIPLYAKRAKIRAQEVLLRAENAEFGAEVGIYYGAMSAFLLRLAPRLRLYMVDSWLIGHRDNRLAAEHHTEFAKDRRTILAFDSLDAAMMVPDQSLDFAFLDADHSYEAVKADIAAWGPKVKPGGWLCGHDYGKRTTPGVTKAVDELTGVELGKDTTWFVRQ